MVILGMPIVQEDRKSVEGRLAWLCKESLQVNPAQLESRKADGTAACLCADDGRRNPICGGSS